MTATDANVTGPSSWATDTQGCGSFTSAQATGSSQATITAPTSPGTYTYTVNYNLTRTGATVANEIGGAVNPAQFTLTVAQQPQTITFNQPDPKLYGDADFDPGATASSGLQVSYSSDTPSVCTIVSGKVHILSAGDCKVTASQAGNASFSAAPPVQRTIVINKAPLTVVTDNQTKKFGQDNPTLTGSVNGIKNSDNITANYSTTATQNSPVGTYPITATLSDPGNKLGNYNVTNDGGTLTVEKATASIALSGLTGNTYDGTAKAATATTTPAGLSGVSVTYDGQPNAPKDAGSYAVVASLTNPNYEAQDATGTLVIGNASLTVEANNASREYGEANPALSGTLTGVANGDNITASYTTGATQASDVGTYDIVPELSDPNNRLSNYDVSKTNGTLTVTEAPLTIKANDASREYGEANPPFTGSIVSGLKNGDALSVTASSSATAASNVGTYDIVPELSGAKASNYDVTAQNGTLTVTAAPLSAEANSASRKYGEANPAFTGTLTGVKNNDAITASYSSSATAASDVGTYDIVPAIDATASVLANYQTPVLTKGTLTVTKADAIEAKANSASRKYGEANPTFTGTLTGVKNGDAISASYSSAATAASDIGTYSIVPSLSDPNNKLSNYEAPVLTDGTLTVTKADAIKATANNASREYGEANPTFTGTLTGVKNGDAISASYSSAATQASGVGPYAIVPSLSDPNNKLSNYEAPILTNGTLTVNKAPITIKANDASRYYNEANPTFGYTIVSGSFKNGDLGNGVSVDLSTTATATSPNGPYPITVALGGTKAGNYALTPVNGTLTITAWTNQGFFAPVDYGTTQNTVKGGSTLPLKFRVFQGTQQLTSTSVVSGLKPTVTNCATGAPIDDIEELATGGTTLRYDTTAGQFIFNWQTPKKPGTCYNVTVQMVDGSSIPIAKFLLK